VNAITPHADELIGATVCNLLHLSVQEREKQECAAVIRTPMAHGGLGIISAADSSVVAYFSATIAALIRAGDTTLIDGAETATTTALNTAWTSIDKILLAHAPTRAMVWERIQVRQSATGLMSCSRLFLSLSPFVQGQMSLTDVDSEDQELQERLADELAEEVKSAVERHKELRERQKILVTTRQAIRREEQATRESRDKSAEEIDREEEEETLRKRIEQSLRSKKFRLQRFFSKAIWQARSSKGDIDCLSLLRRVNNEAQETLSRHAEAATDSEERKKEKENQRRNAHRTQLHVATNTARHFAQKEPTASLIWSTIPSEPVLWVKDVAIRTHARGMLGLPPTPETINCPAQKHETLALKGLQTQNKAYSLDVQHFHSCRSLLHSGYSSTKRHDILVSALSYISKLSFCDTLREPALTDCVHRARLLLQDNHTDTIATASNQRTLQDLWHSPRLSAPTAASLPLSLTAESENDEVVAAAAEIEEEGAVVVAAAETEEDGEAVKETAAAATLQAPGEKEKTGKETRERESEGDLGISGQFLSSFILVDAHICSLSAPSRAKDWLKVTSKPTLTTTHLREAATKKKQKYKRLALNIAPSITPDNDKPLQHFGISFVPAVATPTGILSKEILDLVRVLAKHRIDYERNIMGITTGQNRRYVEYVGLYKRALSAATIKGSIETLTAAPRRLDSRRREGPNLTYRAGDL